MSDLREKIREALINSTAEEYLEIISNPDYISKFMSTAKTISNEMAKVFELEAEGEGFEIEEYGDIIYEQMERIFSDPEQIEQIAYQNACNTYLTRAEALSYLDGYMDAKDFVQNLGQAKLKELRNAHKKFIEKCSDFYDFIENLMDKLAEIAQNNSITEATILDIRNDVIKNLVPNREDYMNIHRNNWKVAKEFSDDLQDIISSGPEARALAKAIIDSMEEAINVLTEDLLKGLVEKIYG